MMLSEPCMTKGRGHPRVRKVSTIMLQSSREGREREYDVEPSERLQGSVLGLKGATVENYKRA